MSGAKPLLPSMSSWNEEGIYRYRRVRKIAKNDYELRHVCLSVCRHGKKLCFRCTVIKECGISVFLKLSIKFKLHHNLTIISGTVRADQYTLFIISLSFLLRMRNVSDKSCRENQNTHFWFSNIFPKIVPFVS
jgi:hypothetical protein